MSDEPSWAQRPWEKAASSEPPATCPPTSASTGRTGRVRAWTLVALVILVLIVLILVITRPLGDAGGDSDSGPSAECLGAMETAAAELDSAAADPLIIATLSECGTADEWLAALEQHPGAMGLTERAEIGDFNLLAACVGQLETPVCADAAEKGRIPGNDG